jgi:hypothetical protein
MTAFYAFSTAGKKARAAPSVLLLISESNKILARIDFGWRGLGRKQGLGNFRPPQEKPYPPPYIGKTEGTFDDFIFGLFKSLLSLALHTYIKMSLPFLIPVFNITRLSPKTAVGTRVAGFFLVHHTEAIKNIPNQTKCTKGAKYTKWP